MKITIQKLKQIIKEEAIKFGNLQIDVDPGSAQETVKAADAERIKEIVLAIGNPELITQLAIKLQGTETT
tara:strand:- start:563 stop:772 length:210 start_codon:yes stop_codon:yes gene_type:complete